MSSAVAKRTPSKRLAKSMGSSSNSGASPLAIISRMVTTNSVAKKSNQTVGHQIAFHIYHTTLHLFYLIVSVLGYFVGHYHRLKLKMLMVTYYHNRTPQLIRQDISKLAKIPSHIAVILQLKENEEGGGIDGLMDQSGEIAAWCVGAGIQQLSIYEKNSTLKSIPTTDLHRSISRKLTSYYGDSRPTFKINSPASGSYANGDGKTPGYSLVINLLSEEDGRETIVDLTRTLAEMAVEDKIRAKDLTIETIDSEMKQLLIDEPDLLILFTPYIDLQGFPPWPIRLSEIFHQPDNEEVSYTVFYKALQKYSSCKINVGR